MDKGHWNRKRVYSIRKFAVGACSVMIGTCAVLFGGNIAGESRVYAEENPVTQIVEKENKENPTVENKGNQSLTINAEVASPEKNIPNPN